MLTAAAQLATLFPETQRHYARCLKKLGYPSAAEAEGMRERRQRQVEDILRVYGPCEDCGCWHLTHKPLTAAQVQELSGVLAAECARFKAVWVHLEQISRPYRKFHAMYKKSIHEMEEDFARQLEALDRMMDYWMAMHQRSLAMGLAQATTAAEARDLDTRALESLDESLRRHTKNRENCLAMYWWYRERAAEIFNQEYPLPAYDWRQYSI